MARRSRYRRNPVWATPKGQAQYLQEESTQPLHTVTDKKLRRYLTVLERAKYLKEQGQSASGAASAQILNDWLDATGTLEAMERKHPQLKAQAADFYADVGSPHRGRRRTPTEGRKKGDWYQVVGQKQYMEGGGKRRKRWISRQAQDAEAARSRGETPRGFVPTWAAKVVEYEGHDPADLAPGFTVQVEPGTASKTGKRANLYWLYFRGEETGRKYTTPEKAAYESHQLVERKGKLSDPEVDLVQAKPRAREQHLAREQLPPLGS